MIQINDHGIAGGVYTRVAQLANVNVADRFRSALRRMTMMRYQMQHVFVAAAMLAITATGSPVFATPPGGGPSITLAQAQQPATPAPTTPAPTTPVPATPAPAAGAQQQPSGTSATMPGQMMEHGQGMGEMGKGMGPMGGQAHPGPMGGMPPCPAGQTMSGTPPTCK